jgi:hypothetical protein
VLSQTTICEELEQENRRLRVELEAKEAEASAAKRSVQRLSRVADLIPQVRQCAAVGGMRRVVVCAVLQLVVIFTAVGCWTDGCGLVWCPAVPGRGDEGQEPRGSHA